MTTPFVVATTCVRRRPWAAAGWRAAMAAQTRRPDAVLVVVDGWSDDESSAATTFNAWALGDKPARDTRVERYPHPSAPGWHRGTRESGWKEVPEGVAGRYSDDQHAHLARLRNWTVERALELWPQCTHIWCTDSDAQPEPDVLELLLAADKPAISALVRNGERAWNFFSGVTEYEGPPFPVWEPVRDGTEPMRLERFKEPFRVTMTGASILLRRNAIEAGYRWAADPKGEDVGAAKVARERGIELWLHPLARCAHRMNGPDQEPLR